MFEFHPIADCFPLLKHTDSKRFDQLKSDIDRNGLLVPIVLLDGMILDGRNRAMACDELGIKPRTVKYAGDQDPADFVWSLNGERRDLSKPARTCAKVKLNHYKDQAAELIRLANESRAEKAKARPRADDGTFESSPQSTDGGVDDRADHFALTARVLAEESNVSPATAARVLWVEEKSPELFEQVANDTISLSGAVREIKKQEVITKLESIDNTEASAAEGLFDVLVIDPPWQMKKIDRDERPNQVAFDYPTMSEAELAAMTIPAANDCHLWVWTTHRFLPMAFRLVQAWGFKYVCTFVWHKPGGFQPIGLPQYNCEFALYARKGKPMFIDTKALPTCFEAPRGAHSEKPEEFYSVVRRVTAGRRLDMFNRRRIEGFTGWGKEAAE